MLKRLLLWTAFCCLSANVICQQMWSDVQQRSVPSLGKRLIVPQKFRTLTLDVPTMKKALATAPKEHSAAAKQQKLVIQLPLPDGSMADFQVEEASMMEEGLQTRYPNIRTYRAKHLTDPTSWACLDFTPKGFHAMVFSHDLGTWYIDPYAADSDEFYVSYFKRDFSKKDAAQHECLTESLTPDPNLNTSPEFSGDCQFRTYRLAIACTGEYANFHGATGTNKAPALAAIVTTMNRVNGIYEKDFALRMVLIANTDQVIYTSPTTDPFTNNDGSTMLGQNQNNMTSVIGAANYDIGHVFSTGGGGIAGLGVVCNNNSKARGVTGLGSPIGDPFDVDYVAHEMGHQFAGNHTYNNCSGSGNTTSGMEPGSGSTIMAYAGICGSNVQNNSDDYFHGFNLTEMNAFITAGGGNSCPVKTPTNNQAPTVQTLPNRTIPKSTPFALTATGSDPDGHPITYCWEQMDPTLAPTPPSPTSTTGPLFRSLKPTSSPTRFFPRLSDVIAGTTWQWERLPSVGRTMNFRVTVRDNFAGGGCTGESNVQLIVANNAGPFVVTAPNTAVTWLVGTPQTVTWDVSGTNAPPINTANVKISLSTDGGFTYPIVLIENTENDGSADVVVPNNLSSTCRVKVEAINNYFYDISNVNFRIELPPTPTFLMSSGDEATVCAGKEGTLEVGLSAILNFSDPINFTVSGLPAGATATVSPNPATLPNDNKITVTISNLTSDMVGVHSLTVTGTSGSITQTATVKLTVQPGAPSQFANANYPSDGASGIGNSVNLEWSAVNFATSYYLEVATNPSFAANTIVFSGNVNSTTQTLSNLANAEVYYWRVRADNFCGNGGNSATFAFQTGNENCNQTFASTNVPVTILDNAANLAISTLNIPVNKIVTDINLSVNIAHSWVGDLVAGLTNPHGDTILLFDRPGAPADEFGCEGNNIVATFDDEAAQTALQFENMCGTGIPSIAGSFQSIEKLNLLEGKTAQGTWSLLVLDVYNEDGGAINAWSLNLCLSDAIVAANLLNNNPLTVPQGKQRNIGTSLLRVQNNASTNQVVYVLLSLPNHGTLTLNGNPLLVGSTFTQANIDGNQLAYTHNGNNATTDSFEFDVEDQSNAAWLHGSVFNINILENNLSGNIAITSSVNCHNANTGEIVMYVSGGTAPFTYSLNGGAGQSSNTFSQLAPGNYTIEVTDANGFVFTSVSVTLENPPALSVTASVSGSDVSANGTGGTGNLSYSIDGQNFSQNPIFENLDNGNYIITVRDANGCTATTSVLVAVNTLLATTSVSQNIRCFGESNGSIEVSAAGGTPPLEFSLNGGTFQNSNIFSGLSAGSYSVEVRDAFGLSITTASINLNEPAQLNLLATSNLNSATLAATGGTGTLLYSLDGSNFQSSNIFNNLQNGKYTAIVRDANGCTASTTVEIAVPVLTATATVDEPVTCFGGGAIVSVSATGGVPPYEYKLDGNAFVKTNVFSNVEAGFHLLVVRDAAGTDIQITNFEITQPDPVVPNASIKSDDLTATATGGTPPFTYTLSNGQINDTGDFPNLPNGSYTLVATDANGCTGAVAFVMNYTTLSANVQVAQPKCNGSSDGGFLISANGGTAPFQFSINGGQTYQSAAIFSGLPAGTYNLVVRDAVGDEFKINNVELLNPPAIQATANVVTSTVTVTATGGTGTLNYSLDGANFQASNVFQNVAGGNYNVVVRDANGCTTTVPVTVLANTLAASVQPFNIPCPGETTTVGICINGGYPPFVVTIDPFLAQQPVVGNCAANIQLQSVPPGIYFVKILDSEGFEQNLTFDFSQNPPIAVSANNNGSNIVVTATGGTPPFQYSLNGGAFQTSNVFTNQLNGEYTIVVKDASGCTQSVVYQLNGAVEPSETWRIGIAPNPSTGVFQILINNELAASLHFAVFNSVGQQLRNFVIEKSGSHFSQHPLDLSDLPVGNYLLRVTDGSDVGTLRISVIR